MNPIKQARLAKGLTQVQLARKVGVDSITISRWERREFAPTGARLLKLAKVLDVDPAALLKPRQKEGK
jgi:transcriptional regulator with XRE-family HTH domain